jgi:hypothetical protein
MLHAFKESIRSADFSEIYVLCVLLEKDELILTLVKGCGRRIQGYFVMIIPPVPRTEDLTTSGLLFADSPEALESKGTADLTIGP